MGHRVIRGQKGWVEIIRGHEKSGLSARAFCVRESINPTSFYKWRGRIRREGECRTAKLACRRDEFIEIGRISTQDEVMSKGAAHPIEVKLDFGDGFTVTVRRG
jgi:hypothetical protein